CVLTGACPTVTSSAAVLTVLSLPTVNPSASLNSICTGSSTNLTSVGAATAFNTPTTFSATVGTSIPNPSNVTGLNIPIVISGAPASLALVTNLSVTINISHGDDNEVEAYLIRPGGT